jgi:site-specific recombinase XerC
LNCSSQQEQVAIAVKNTTKITPHVFRHTFATLLPENDADIKYIQTLLGQSSITTTQIYTQVNLEKQKRILTEMHPDIRYIEFIEFNLSLRAYNRQLTDSCLLIEMIRESK